MIFDFHGIGHLRRFLEEGGMLVPWYLQFCVREGRKVICCSHGIGHVSWCRKEGGDIFVSMAFAIGDAA